MNNQPFIASLPILGGKVIVNVHLHTPMVDIRAEAIKHVITAQSEVAQMTTIDGLALPEAGQSYIKALLSEYAILAVCTVLEFKLSDDDAPALLMFEDWYEADRTQPEAFDAYIREVPQTFRRAWSDAFENAQAVLLRPESAPPDKLTAAQKKELQDPKATSPKDAPSGAKESGSGPSPTGKKEKPSP